MTTSSPRILDLGAGPSPHRSATDAIDILDRKRMLAIARAAKRSQLRKFVLPPKVRYRFGVDMNVRLPYASNTFEKVVSRYSICAFGTEGAFLEAYRVLVPGGKIEIWAGDRENAGYARDMLTQAGFLAVTVIAIPNGGMIGGRWYDDEDFRVSAKKPKMA